MKGKSTYRDYPPFPRQADLKTGGIDTPAQGSLFFGSSSCSSVAGSATSARAFSKPSIKRLMSSSSRRNRVQWARAASSCFSFAWW